MKMSTKEKQRRLMEVGRKSGLSTTIGSAKKRNMKTFKDKKGTEKAAVTKEDMMKAGFKSFGKESLRRYLMGLGPKNKKTPIFDEAMGMAKKGGSVVKAMKTGGKIKYNKGGGDLFVSRAYGGKIGK